MISMLRELLTFLGAHFYLVLIGCGELVLAVILLTALSERRNGARRRVPVTVPGSGPDGLVVERDVQNYIANQPTVTPLAANQARIQGIDLSGAICCRFMRRGT